MNTKLLTAAASSSLLLMACFGTDSDVTTEQDLHLEPVAIEIVQKSNDSSVAILYSPDALADSVSQNKFSLSVDDSLEYKVKLWCEHEGELEVCELEAHDDHDDHDDHDHDEDHMHEEDTAAASEEEVHNHEDDHDHHEDAEYTLSLKSSDESVVMLDVHADEFEFSAKALSEGTSELTLEVLHGSHADISGQIFEVEVN